MLLTLLAASISVVAHAEGVPADVERVVRVAIATANPQATIDAVAPAPIPGLTQVVSNGEVLYVSNDGTYLFFQGSLYRIADKTDMAEVALAPVRAAALADVTESDAIVYKAPEEKFVVTVFTDVECGYCRMFHGKINDYLAAGITVRYVSFPRSGPNTPAWTTAEAVWCSEDRQAALTTAKLGQAVTAEPCANPVAKDFALGRRVGVRGTPAIYDARGRQLGGFVSPEVMLRALQAP